MNIIISIILMNNVITRLPLRQVKLIIIIAIVNIIVIITILIISVHNYQHNDVNDGDQANAKQQQHQGGVAITNLITFKCLNIIFCVGEISFEYNFKIPKLRLEYYLH